ncbi:MAG: hypothetical protein KUG77_20575 [Nannocystaceae bacterium]|nr:hypothetical protein [Nannocystaceae bacterium]
MRYVHAIIHVVAALLISSGCGTDSAETAATGSSGGGAETGAQTPTTSTSTTGTSSSTSPVAGTSSGSGSTGPLPDVPLPSGPDGVVCGALTCAPEDACNICNEDGSTSCVPPTGGVVCLDGWTLDCDGPEDCEAGQHCVLNETQLGNLGSCADEDSFVVCDATPQIVCHDDEDCPSSCQYCVAPKESANSPVSFCRAVP